METESSKDDIFGKLSDERKAISELHQKLNEINAKKEAAYQEKEQVSKKIIKIIADIRASKSVRDSFTKQAKESKEKRTSYNEEIRKKIEEVKALEKEKDKIRKQLKIRTDPSRIKQDIEKLEYIIETEALSVPEEKRVMQKIKEKKKEYEEAKKGSDIFEKIHALSKELDGLRKKSDEEHKKVKSSASDSQERHEDIIESSKEIRDLRQKEREAFENFMVYKKLFIELNSQLKQRRRGVDGLRKEADDAREESGRERKKKTGQLIREKQAEVEKKLARGEKLTTEDLIAMQGAM